MKKRVLKSTIITAFILLACSLTQASAQESASKIQSSAQLTEIPLIQETEKTDEQPQKQRHAKLFDSLHPGKILVPAGTRVTLRFDQTISTASAKVGDRVEFSLVKDLVIGKYLLLPAGSLSYAEIIQVHPPDTYNNGRFMFHYPILELGDGDKIRLMEGTLQERKEKREAAAVVVPLEIVFAPIWVPVYLISKTHDDLHPSPSYVKTFDRIFYEDTTFDLYTRHDVWIHTAKLKKHSDGLSNDSTPH